MNSENRKVTWSRVVGTCRRIWLLGSQTCVFAHRWDVCAETLPSLLPTFTSLCLQWKNLCRPLIPSTGSPGLVRLQRETATLHFRCKLLTVPGLLTQWFLSGLALNVQIYVILSPFIVEWHLLSTFTVSFFSLEGQNIKYEHIITVFGSGYVFSLAQF